MVALTAAPTAALTVDPKADQLAFQLAVLKVVPMVDQ